MTTEAQPPLGSIHSRQPPAVQVPALLGTAGNPRPRAWLALAGFLVVTYAVSALSSLATVDSVPTWYAALAKPPLNPPNWIFAPVWTVLYTAMAGAAWLVWRTRKSVCRTSGLRLYAVQLLLNLGWTWIFFAQHRPGLALVDIALLWLAIALMIRSFRKMSHKAAGLLAPYLAWVSFAVYLNWGIWRLNP